MGGSKFHRHVAAAHAPRYWITMLSAARTAPAMTSARGAGVPQGEAGNDDEVGDHDGGGERDKAAMGKVAAVTNDEPEHEEHDGHIDEQPAARRKKVGGERLPEPLEGDVLPHAVARKRAMEVHPRVGDEGDKPRPADARKIANVATNTIAATPASRRCMTYPNTTTLRFTSPLSMRSKAWLRSASPTRRVISSSSRYFPLM